MIVTCGSVSEFLDELNTYIQERGVDCVYLKTIRWNRSEQPLPDSENTPIRNIVRFEICVAVSAVLDLGVEGQFLLHAGELCGIDYRDASQEFEGSEKADELRNVLDKFCADHDLRVGHGVIQV